MGSIPATPSQSPSSIPLNFAGFIRVEGCVSSRYHHHHHYHHHSFTVQVSFVVKAVSALTAAFRLVQLDSCGQSVEEACLREVWIMIEMMIMSLANLVDRS